MTDEQNGLEEAATVRQWMASYQESWHEPLPKEEAFAALERFLELCESDPDSIIGEVLRPAPQGEGVVLRTRARRKYLDLIDQFESQTGSRQTANYVRSFMIHNGVAMTPPVLT